MAAGDGEEDDPFLKDAESWAQRSKDVVAAARRGEGSISNDPPLKGGPLNPYELKPDDPTEPDGPREAWPVTLMPDGEDVCGNGCVLKRVLNPGVASLGKPAFGCNIKMHYTARRSDGRQWDTSIGKYDHFHFIVGMHYVNKLFEAAIPTMQHGEVAEFVCTRHYAEGNDGTHARMPRLERVFRYEVELFSWREPRTLAEGKFDLTGEECLAELEMLKRNAARYVAESQWADALERYRDAIFLVAEDFDDREDVTADADLRGRAASALAACRLNASMCALKLEEYRLAESMASAALSHEPQSVKGLYRRGLARIALHEFATAKDDLRNAAEIEPGSRDVRAAYDDALAAERAAEVRDASFASKAFVHADGEPTELYEAPREPAAPLPPRRVWLDVAVDGEAAGRIDIELHVSGAPRACENFRSLCTGEAGRAPVSGARLCYAGAPFHRVVAGLAVCGGDVVRGDGTGVESIYNGRFGAETGALKHDGPGVVSMAATSGGASGCQFFITTAAAPHLDGEHAPIGRVVGGMEVVRRIELQPTDAKDRPVARVVIEACGEE